MSTSKLRRRLLLAGTSMMFAGTTVAQTVAEPVFGTPGKDSGWIPTPEGMVEAAGSGGGGRGVEAATVWPRRGMAR